MSNNADGSGNEMLIAQGPGREQRSGDIDTDNSGGDAFRVMIHRE